MILIGTFGGICLFSFLATGNKTLFACGIMHVIAFGVLFRKKYFKQ